MVKNGSRASEFPSFEESDDWMESIAVTFVLAFIMLMPLLGSAIFFPKFFEIMIPVINVNIGQYITVLFWLACVYIYTWHRSQKQREYAEVKAAIDRKDDEEYQAFVRIACARRNQ